MKKNDTTKKPQIVIIPWMDLDRECKVRRGLPSTVDYIVTKPGRVESLCETLRTAGIVHQVDTAGYLGHHTDLSFIPVGTGQDDKLDGYFNVSQVSSIEEARRKLDKRRQSSGENAARTVASR